MQHPDTTKLQTLLAPAAQVAILLPQNPSYDAVAAALAWKLALDQAGKKTVVACPDPVTVEFHRLVGADTVIANFGSRNLVITFPGQTEMVDKVSYNIENGVLQLVITPKAEAGGLDHRKLHFVSSGAQAEAVILIGVRDMADLGQIYVDAKDFLAKVPQYSLVDTLLSQATAQLLASLRLPLNPDVASNLLSGLERATSNFSSANTTADTFEIAAQLLRHGARRQSDLAAAGDFPSGAIPTTPPPDWTEPKIYRGTTVS